MSTLVKICGVRTPEQALVAADAGANLIGLVFYPPSPRCVTPAEAAAIVRALRAAGSAIIPVGLFVDETPERVNQVVAEVGLAMAQLSGDEPPGDLARIRAPVLRVVRVAPDSGIGRVRERLAACTVMVQGRDPGPLGQPLIPMLDAHVPGYYGGTGARADWSLAARFARLWPLFLAGGLAPENVGEAIAAVRPLGVDVSSGVETGRIKDSDKIRAFVRAVRDADNRTTDLGDHDNGQRAIDGQ